MRAERAGWAGLGAKSVSHIVCLVRFMLRNSDGLRSLRLQVERGIVPVPWHHSVRLALRTTTLFRTPLFMSKLTLHELTISPNNVKVRIGLGYKGLEYDRKPLEFGAAGPERAELVKLSRQTRTPVLEHGDTVIYDSNGILRYLDANFPETPTLYSEDHETMGKIEQFELWARTDLSKPIGMIFGQAFSAKQDAAVGVEASELLHELTAKIEKTLEASDYLLGATPTGADLAIAPFIRLGMLSEEGAQVAAPITTVFHKMLQLGEGRERTRAWVKRLHEYDAVDLG